MDALGSRSRRRRQSYKVKVISIAYLRDMINRLNNVWCVRILYCNMVFYMLYKYVNSVAHVGPHYHLNVGSSPSEQMCIFPLPVTKECPSI